MKQSAAKTVEEYIAAAVPETRPLLQEMRQVILKNAPESEESISYQMPAYKYLGRPLVYFGGFKNHVSLFAAGSQRVARVFAKELAGYIQSKGTIQFPLGKPLPTELIAKIVQLRVAENQERKK
jgi:uncharacterized protein YdhG (YjbR/CyaY superfamily)